MCVLWAVAGPSCVGALVCDVGMRVVAESQHELLQQRQGGLREWDGEWGMGWGGGGKTC